MTQRTDTANQDQGDDEEPMSPDEYAELRKIPITDDEVRELMELVRWFRRRYPTVRERFAYVRRKHDEALRARRRPTS